MGLFRKKKKSVEPSPLDKGLKKNGSNAKDCPHLLIDTTGNSGGGLIPISHVSCPKLYARDGKNGSHIVVGDGEPSSTFFSRVLNDFTKNHCQGCCPFYEMSYEESMIDAARIWRSKQRVEPLTKEEADRVIEMAERVADELDGEHGTV